MSINKDSYNFESLKKIESVERNVSSKSKAKPTLSFSKLLVILFVVSLFIGFRWRYSFGGKLILINAFTIVLPYYFLCSNQTKGKVLVQTLALLASTLISFSIGIYGYMNYSVGDLTVDRNEISTQEHQGAEFKLYANGAIRSLDYLNIKSSNEDVAFIYRGYNHIYTGESGKSKISIFDDYGNKVVINVSVSKSRTPASYISMINPVVRLGERKLFYVYTDGDYQNSFNLKIHDGTIAGINFDRLYGLKPGVTKINISHESIPHFSTEVTVIDNDDYIWGLCNYFCAQYSVGDTINGASIIPNNAKNVTLTPDGSVFKKEGDSIIASEEGEGSIIVHYDETIYTLRMSVSKTKVRAATISNYDGNTVELTKPIKLGLTTYPSDSKADKIEYSISDSSVANIDQDGNLTPVGTGYAFVTITLDDNTLEIPVSVNN